MMVLSLSIPPAPSLLVEEASFLQPDAHRAEISQATPRD
jgi:hypothetical protein